MRHIDLAQYSLAFRLAALCCGWPLNEVRQGKLRELAVTVDWHSFLNILRRHRIAALAYRAISTAGIDLPDKVARSLAQLAHEAARRSLNLAAEAGRMQQLFMQSGLAPLTLKGAPIALQLYGDLGLRHSKDIDFVFAPEEIHQAIALVEAEGYVRINPPKQLTNPDLWRRFQKARKECEFYHPIKKLQLEVHWRLTDNLHLLACPARSTWQAVSLDAHHHLLMLAPEDQFTYLCVHGCIHGWMRLKWLADIAAIIAQQGCADLTRLLLHAEQLDLRRCALTGLGLCALLLESDIPADISKQIESDPIVQGLIRVACLVLTYDNGERELIDQRLTSSLINGSHFFLKTDLHYQWQELKNWTMYEKDFLTLPLPEALHFLYPLLRLPLWAVRRTRNLGRAR